MAPGRFPRAVDQALGYLASSLPKLRTIMETTIHDSLVHWYATRAFAQIGDPRGA